MTSIKLKFRPSTNPQKEGSLIFQLIHERTVRRIKSKYKVFNYEWDEDTGQILLPMASSPRFRHLETIRFNIKWEINQLKRIIETLAASGKEWNLDDVINRFSPSVDARHSVFNFINAQILHKKQLGKIRSSETYQATLNSFMRFRKM